MENFKVTATCTIVDTEVELRIQQTKNTVPENFRI